MSDAISNTSVNKKTTYVFNYSIDLDVEKNTLIIIFEKEPVTKKIIKNLNDELSSAKDNEGNKIFNANEIQQIWNKINAGIFTQMDQTLKLKNFNIKLKFNIKGYNNDDNITIEGDIARNTAYYDKLDEIAKARQEELEEAITNFELGVVEEEYTPNPVLIKKRVTLELIHELYGILNEFFPILKIVTTLISNYKINKAKVENNSRGNLLGMCRFLAKTANLNNKVNIDTKNFYTVRTLKLYDYVQDNFLSETTATISLTNKPNL